MIMVNEQKNVLSNNSLFLIDNRPLLWTLTAGGGDGGTLKPISTFQIDQLAWWLAHEFTFIQFIEVEQH